MPLSTSNQMENHSLKSSAKGGSASGGKITKIAFTFSILIFAFSIYPNMANAATKYWVGGNGDNVGTNANDWSTSDPAVCADGAGDASAVPGASDIAVFDADCDSNAAIDANWSVAGLTISSGYTGALTQ